MGDATDFFGFYNADGKAPETCDVFRTMSFADAAPVFIEVPIKNVMATVFDGPMAPVGGEYFFGISLIGRPAVDAIGDFTGYFSGFFVNRFPFDGERLADVREVQIGVQFGCDPDFAGVDATVIAGGRFNEVRCASILEEEFDGFKESGLVAFDGEVIMGLSFNDVIADVALGQQGVGGDGFALDGNGVEQGNDGFDFVGAFGFVAAGDGQ